MAMLVPRLAGATMGPILPPVDRRRIDPPLLFGSGLLSRSAESGPDEDPFMLKRRGGILIALVLATPAFLAAPVYGLSPADPPAAPESAAVEAEAANPAAIAEEPAAPPSPAPEEKPAPKKPERYQDGIVIWQTPDDAQFPFLLKFNINTQIRYLNTTDSEDTFTDHLGLVRDVNERNDITVNRTMFILGG